MGLPADDQRCTARVGSIVGDRYELVEVLGQGATSTVFRAVHQRLRRQFAVKVLHVIAHDEHRLRDRFRAEITTLGAMRHPNIVAIVDAGESPAGELYLVMEYAAGVPLDAIIANRPMEGRRVVQLALQMTAGLASAHALGVIHRDFKPANVIIELEGGRELVRIIDFGISIGSPQGTREVRQRRLTDQGLLVGTPYYMAPEHAMGLPIDVRADLFSLGLVLYEMIAGRPPHEGEPYEVIHANAYTPAPPLGERVLFLEVDPVLDALVRGLLVKEPAQRFQSAQQVHDLLALLATDRVAAARALGVDRRERRRRRSASPPLAKP